MDTDTMFGGNGDDWTPLTGSINGEVVAGNSGVDTLVLNLGSPDKQPSQTVIASEGGLRIDVVVLGTGFEVFSITTGDAADVIGGGRGDKAYAHSSNDMIDGGGGNDTLYAMDGNDTTEGGAGDNTLWGVFSEDALFGGAGNDAFGTSREYDDDSDYYDGSIDFIVDFGQGED